MAKVKMLSGERHRERVITPKEEARYLGAALSLLHDVSLVLPLPAAHTSTGRTHLI